MEKKNEQLNKLKLSTQRALWGMIYPNIRAIAVGLPKNDKLEIIIYLDRSPIESDYENLNEVTTEILSDMPELKEFNEKCIFSKDPLNKLDILDSLVYARKE